jgi:hypothetical protein
MTEPSPQQQSDAPEPREAIAGETRDATPPDPGGAKLFVIFFLAIVPLLGLAIMALVIYSLLMR